MPLDCLHMTALEIAHSLTNSEIDRLVTTIQSKILEITDYTVNHRARLVQPLLSYDAQAVALSFLPGSTNSSEERSQDEADEFTYHHLRRDLYDLCRSTGVQVASRYVVPSAHLTIARYMNGKAASGNGDHKALDSTSMAAWIEHIEDINRWLKAEFWPGTSTNRELEWVVGDETGLDCRRGTVWYGGGSSVRVGQGSKSPK